MVADNNSSITRFFKKPGLTTAKAGEILIKLQQKNPLLKSLDTELCYHIETNALLTGKDKHLIKWILQESFHPENIAEENFLEPASGKVLVEVGPRFNFSTSNSTNAVAIFRNLGLSQVVRVEVSRRYLLKFPGAITKKEEDDLASLLYDRMTECRYTLENIPKRSFNEKLVKKENIKEIDVLKRGEDALKEINDELGLAFDEADYKYYTNLFKNLLKRNPTNVECFDLAQSNSEHSRHWFFKGKMVIDGVEHEESLIDMISDTQKSSNPNNVIKFSDNSR